MQEQELTVSQQQYLYCIYELSLTQDTIRQTDVAQKLRLSRASVCIAVHTLMEKGLLCPIKEELILSEVGKGVARQLFEKVTTIANVLQIADIYDKNAVSIAFSMNIGQAKRLYQCIKKKK